MEFGDTAKNIISFGAHGRVMRKQAEFDDVRPKLEKALKDLDSVRTRTNSQTQSLVKTKQRSVETLRAISRISKCLAAKDRSVGEAGIQASNIACVARIDETISHADLARNTARGLTTGASTALGTWALVGAYGTASTGTAIGGLSGAAASNAILAWLGGGSLVTGGGGMAAGAAVLGGVVLVPAALIMAIFSHLSANKKIKVIQERVAQALASIEQCRGTQLMLEGLERRIREVSISIEKARCTFQTEFDRAYATLFPYGIFSKAIRHFRKWFGGKFFHDADLETISPLLQIAALLASLIDQKLLDDNGNIL